MFGRLKTVEEEQTLKQLLLVERNYAKRKDVKIIIIDRLGTLQWT